MGRSVKKDIFRYAKRNGMEVPKNYQEILENYIMLAKDAGCRNDKLINKAINHFEVIRLI